MPALPTTCLFSGKPTGERTTEEHTILRGLAGRFRSRTAAASSFNSRTSNVMDAPLVAVYALIMNALAPLLSSEHRPGSLEITGQPGERLVLDPGAVARLRGVRIEARDPSTGRPTAMSAENSAALLTLARQLEIPESNFEKMTTVPVTSHHVERRQSILSPWAETAVLKCALLTFDHLLGSQPGAFTRSSRLAAIRDAILAIVEGASPALLIGLTSWGIDNSQRDALLTIANQYRPAPKSRFENLLLVSAQEGCSVDLHCLIAGVDVYRFRICDRWDGPTFALLCGAGMLIGDVPYGPISVPVLLPMGPRTLLRSVFPEGASSEHVAEVARRINEERQLAYVEAVLLVETMADDFVIERILGLEAVGAITLEHAIRQRIHHLYEDSVAVEREPLFAAILNESINSLGNEIRQGRPSAVHATEWLAAYRSALGRLCRELGRPVLTAEIVTNRAAVRTSIA